MSGQRFTLGQRVKFTETVTKRRSDGKGSWGSAGLPAINDAWLKSAIVDEGVIVGGRTLLDYKFDREYDDWGGGYYTVSSPIAGTGRKAWLVAFHLRRKPALVLDEHVQAIGEGLE